MAISKIITNSIDPSVTLTTPIVATTMGVGNATPSASGSGITFPATQSASTDANTLDDYEEGTFTPTLGGASSDPTGVSYSTQKGSYVKIGKVVTVTFQMDFTTYTGGSGFFRLRGLPFAAISSIAQFGTACMEYVTLSAGKTTAVFSTVGGDTALTLYQWGSNTTYNDVNLTAMASSATVKYVDGTIVYITA